MDPLDIQPNDGQASAPTPQTVVAGRVEDLPPGYSLSVRLDDGNTVAVYNVGGEFFATDNSCPHHGAPLVEGRLCGYLIECYLHGWQFDVRNGQCLTVSESITTYRVLVDNGLIKIEVGESTTGC
jgi:nitrite reductase/ring-hydroxylating ferredoxin subunit